MKTSYFRSLYGILIFLVLSQIALLKEEEFVHIGDQT